MTILYRAPVAYRVARPFRSGGSAMEPGQVISASEVEALGLMKMVESRNLRPIVSPEAQRADPADDVMERLTVAEIMRIVGDDPVLAQAYLESEEESEKPRSTLVGSLMTTIKSGQGSPA